MVVMTTVSPLESLQCRASAAPTNYDNHLLGPIQQQMNLKEPRYNQNIQIVPNIRNAHLQWEQRYCHLNKKQIIFSPDIYNTKTNMLRQPTENNREGYEHW